MKARTMWVAVMLGSATVLLWLGQSTFAAGQPAATGKRIVELQIDGGYGYLTSLSLKRDGALAWTGHEPPRKSASTLEGKLPEKEVEEIWTAAGTLREAAPEDSYDGGGRSYDLVLMFEDRSERRITIKAGEPDSRPEQLRSLLERMALT